MTAMNVDAPSHNIRIGLSILTWTGIAITLVVSILLVVNPTYRVQLSATKLQEQIDSRLPFEVTKNWIALKIERGAKLELLDGNGLRISLPSFSARPLLAKDTHFEGTLIVRGELYFLDRAFYLKDAIPEKLEGQWKLSKRAQTAEDILKDLGDTLPLPKGRDDSALKRAIDPEALKVLAMKWVETKLVDRELYRIGNESPIHAMVGASLESLTISNNEVVAVLGVRGLLTYIFELAGLTILIVTLVLGRILGVHGLGLGLKFLGGALRH